MRSELFRAAGSVLGRAASIGDTLVSYTRVLADSCMKAALRQGHAVECPYCQEHIRTAEDHMVWCDMVDSLRTPLADKDTHWPIMRYGIAINREWAEALTRPMEKKP